MEDIQAWMDSAKRYPLLPAREVLRLAKIIQSPDTSDAARQRAVSKLVRHNLRLIPKIVRQLTDSKCSYNYGDSNTVDLLQQGAIGLQRAAELFDPTRGYAFSTYATPWIKQAVRRFANNNYSPIRIPENTLKDYFQLKVNDVDFKSVEKQSLRRRLADAYYAINMNSLDAPPPAYCKVDEDTDWHEAIPAEESSTTPNPKMTFEEIIGNCNLEERHIVTLRKRYQENSMDVEIAKEMGLCRSTVSNNARKAILRLRKYHSV